MLTLHCFAIAWWSAVANAWRPNAPTPIETTTSTCRDDVLHHIASQDGWSVQPTLGPTVARQLGGSGSLATNGEAENIADVRLGLTCAFAIEPEYAPPQGTVALLRPSRYFSTSTAAEESAAARANNRPRPVVAKGFWTVDATDDDDVPTTREEFRKSKTS